MYADVIDLIILVHVTVFLFQIDKWPFFLATAFSSSAKVENYNFYDYIIT